MQVVSIRTRLVNRVRPMSRIKYQSFTYVSIRTRLVNRVRREAVGHLAEGRSCFNPHPAGEPGETDEGFAGRAPDQVSIRTRLVNRVRLALPPTHRKRGSGRFNPHPAGEPGETKRLRRILVTASRFQSAPGW